MSLETNNPVTGNEGNMQPLSEASVAINAQAASIAASVVGEPIEAATNITKFTASVMIPALPHSLVS